MNKMFISSTSVILFVLLIVNVGYADGLPHENYIFGAKSQTFEENQKGAQTTFEIIVPQTFTETGEDHNWHLEVSDDNGFHHLLGYFLNEADPTTPKYFIEVFNQSGVKQWGFEGMGAVGTNGQKLDFTIHHFGDWSYYVDGDLKAQSINSTANTLSSSEIWVLAEKICPNAPYCTKDQGGPMPSMTIDDPILYTSTETPINIVWKFANNATSYYQVKGAGNPTSTNSDLAVAESCPPLSMKGNAQDYSLDFRQLVLGSNVITPCTPRQPVILWDQCSAPVTGDWTITKSCTLRFDTTVTGNVVVQNNSSLILENNVDLNIDFLNKFLKIEEGSKVVIKVGGSIS